MKKLNTNLNFGGNSILKTTYKITELESSKRFGQKRMTYESKPRKIVQERKLSKYTSMSESKNMMQFLGKNLNEEIKVKKILESELKRNFNENVRWR